MEQCEILSTVQQNAVWLQAVSQGWPFVVKCPSKQQSCRSREGLFLDYFGFRLEFLHCEGRYAEYRPGRPDSSFDSSTDAEPKVPCPQRPMTQVLSLPHSNLFACLSLRLPSTVVLVGHCNITRWPLRQRPSGSACFPRQSLER